jgi:hypothetical protein
MRGPGTPNAAPKQSTVILTCYFVSVINLGRAFLQAGESPQPLPAEHP